jgi:hypothetical protein
VKKSNFDAAGVISGPSALLTPAALSARPPRRSSLSEFDPESVPAQPSDENQG